MEYKATVTLTAAAGYTFTEMKSRFFHAEEASDITTSNNSGGAITVSIPFLQLSTFSVGATWYVDRNGDNSNSGSAAKPLRTIKKALDKAKDAKADGTLKDGETAEIVLLSDITPLGAPLFEQPSPETITELIVIEASHPFILLRSQSSQTPRTVWLEEGEKQTLITVKDKATLTLKHITLQGPQDEYESITLISTAGNLVFESGASVKDGKKKDSGNATGGVYVDGGTFIMKKGTISGNQNGCGGGVYVINGGTFTMNGGVISGNSGSIGGGGVNVMGDGSEFNMYGGVISGNTATNGGGVFVTEGSEFTMYGGVISGNTATNGGGVYVRGSFIDVDNYLAATFTMYGGVISGNTASGGGGGGVAVGHDTPFTKTGGVIYGSDADNDFKNTATNDNGHAVYMEDSSPKKRNSTAWENDDMSSPSGSGWE
jgi:hypothetical protein